jgi:hypothetical protein
MIATSIRHLVLVLGPCCCRRWRSAQRLERIPPRVHVGIRTIGHAVLLAVGDSTSLVLPVQREARYLLDHLRHRVRVRAGARGRCGG